MSLALWILLTVIPVLLCFASTTAMLQAVCNDVGTHCRCQALRELQGVTVLTTAQYFAQYWAHVPVVSDLYDSIQQSRQSALAEGPSSQSTGGFTPHLSAHTLEQELNAGTVLQVWPHANRPMLCCYHCTHVPSKA